MKAITSQKVAIYITGIVLASLAGFFLLNWNILLNPLTYFFFLFIFGIFLYWVIRSLVNKFLYNKIRVLYKIISDTHSPENELKSKIKRNDILEEAEKEVLEWSRQRGSLVAQLKKQEKYRKEFIGNVSHELKTPIFNIQGYILTLLDGGLEDATINRAYLKRSEKNITRMINIVKDLEIISKLESGEHKPAFEQFGINELIYEVIDMQEMRAQKHNISLKFHFRDDPVLVWADRGEIFQVLNNLVANSITYGKDGGNTVIEVVGEDSKVTVSVKDDGIGIEPDNLPRIFERFYRVDKSRSRNVGGSGLGLAIVKHVIDAHNQKINVNSIYGKGTNFSFTLEKTKLNEMKRHEQ